MNSFNSRIPKNTFVGLVLAVTVFLRATAATPTPCPFLRTHRDWVRGLGQEAGDNSTISGNGDCFDLLPSVEESPIKECSALFQFFPCGTMLEPQGVLVDVICAKSCGACGLDDQDRSSSNNTETPEQPKANESTFMPFTRTFYPPSAQDSSTEYTTFYVDSDHVTVLTSVPLDTEWVGYMLVPSSLSSEPEVHDYPLSQFVFSFDSMSGNVIKARAWFPRFVGPTPSTMQGLLGADLTTAVECSQEMQDASGGLCQYDEEHAVGDFMFVAMALVVILGERYEDPNLQILSVQELASARVVQWRIPRYNFLKVEDLRIRYAVKSVGYDTSYVISDITYHGAGYSSHVPFALTDPLHGDKESSYQPTVVDGYIQHSSSQQEDGSFVWTIGGTFGWSIPPPGTRAYQSLVVPPGTRLKFVYGFPWYVLRVMDKDAFDECNLENAVELSEMFGSPFEEMLLEPGDYFFTFPTNEASSKGLCGIGGKLHVVVQEQEQAQGDSSPNGNESSTARHGVGVAVVLVAMFLLECIIF